MIKKIVIIGDLISSRKISNRGLIQKKLQEALKENNKKDDTILSPFTITLGDEFQAVLIKCSDVFFLNTISILLKIFPVKIRFSIGIGAIETPINKKLAIGMDGQAFYNARKGINEMKEEKGLYKLTGIDPEKALFANDCLYLISHFIMKWKKNQLQIFYYLNEKLNVKEISEKMHISKQAVYKSLDNEEMKVLVNIFNNVSNLINQEIA